MQWLDHSEFSIDYYYFSYIIKLCYYQGVFGDRTRKLTWSEVLCIKSKVQTIPPNSPL